MLFECGTCTCDATAAKHRDAVREYRSTRTDCCCCCCLSEAAARESVIANSALCSGADIRLTRFCKYADQSQRTRPTVSESYANVVVMTSTATSVQDAVQRWPSSIHRNSVESPLPLPMELLCRLLLYFCVCCLCCDAAAAACSKS